MTPLQTRLLEEERLELQSEVYGGELHWREVPINYFFDWYKWRMEEQPEVNGIRLCTFDVISVQSFFEDWVKQGMSTEDLSR